MLRNSKYYTILWFIFVDIVDPMEEELEVDEDDFDDDISEELEDLGLTPEAIEEALRSSGRRLDDTDDEDDEDTTSLSQIDDSEDSEAANELARFQVKKFEKIKNPGKKFGKMKKKLTNFASNLFLGSEF